MTRRRLRASAWWESAALATEILALTLAEIGSILAGCLALAGIPTGLIQPWPAWAILVGVLIVFEAEPAWWGRVGALAVAYTDGESVTVRYTAAGVAFLFTTGYLVVTVADEWESVVAFATWWKRLARVGRPARVMIAIAALILPSAHRIRYLEEFHAELIELPRRERTGYATRQLCVALRLRRSLSATPDSTARRPQP